MLLKVELMLEGYADEVALKEEVRLDDMVILLLQKQLQTNILSYQFILTKYEMKNYLSYTSKYLTLFSTSRPVNCSELQNETCHQLETW